MSMPSLQDIAFTSSTPGTRPAWCDSVGTWRVAHADRLEAAIAADPSAPRSVYVVHASASRSGQKRLWVGLRGYSTSVEKSEKLAGLQGLLRRRGLSVRALKSDGLVVDLVVTDRDTP